MGLFLSLSGIINKPATDVTRGLEKYLSAAGGGIELAQIDSNHKNFCVIQESEGNTTITYPSYFLEWDECSMFLSKELGTPVFSFHIHDGDFWMYTLFVDGEIKDQFLPIPDYFDDSMNEEEIDELKGNVQILTKYVTGLASESVEKYLIRWDFDQPEAKAYEDDEFTNCDWQLIDFLRKLKLPYPLDDKGDAKGEVYKFWTAETKVEEGEKSSPIDESLTKATKNKPWWKFW